MTKIEDNRYMYELRQSGATYKEIAEELGLTIQGAYTRVKMYEKKLKGTRGKGFNIETIVYKGFYEYFKDNVYESLSGLCTKTLKLSEPNIVKLKDFITGRRNPRFSISEIKKMCEVTGKSFEELIELRGKE